MRLDDLLRDVGGAAKVPALEVAGVAEDSRRVEPGDAFVARPGTRHRGEDFVAEAVRRGAVVVVAEEALDVNVPCVVVPSAAQALGMMAQRLAGEPTQTLKVFAVTGTNGKTTTCHLLRHVLNTLGTRCGLIGTVEIDDGRAVRPAKMTTPPPVELAALFKTMLAGGCGAVAMEASSHALDQHRLAGVQIHAAGFTNLTDHLDYHGTMEAYAAAKARLFQMLPPGATAAGNADSPWADRVVVGGARTDFGTDAAWSAENVEVSAAGTRFDLRNWQGDAEVTLPLIGRHNVENALCCCAMVGGDVDDVSELAAALSTAPPVPGRLERVGEGSPTVLVDYAHTDDALANVLRALRPLTAGRLRVVVGCGGDRDRTKRPRMASVAEAHADDLYLTSDNPRTEDPGQILADMRAGLRGSPHFVSVDRRATIQAAIADAGQADVVLIAGKGHETYQILGTEKQPFDDREEARAALTARNV